MKPIAITQGDPAGIGPEIVARCFAEPMPELNGCFVVGDVATIRRAAGLLNLPVPLPVLAIDHPEEAHSLPPRCVPVLQVTDAGLGVAPLGQVSAQAGKAASQAVIWAARAALKRQVAALVTAPLHKESLHAAGIAYPGHTELLQAEAAAHLRCPVAQLPVRMMLANHELRTVLVSIHVSLRQAIAAVTTESVLQTLRITDRSLTALLGRAPRLAVAGLNPHAGEGGLFGSEELEIITPAINAARGEGINATGPHPPDTIFMTARRSQSTDTPIDAVIAMYHDQGLIPVKYLGFDQGVNVTLGLPMVRTSPDHGTAFDLAGKGVADPSSLLEAIRMARRLVGAP